MTHAHHADVEVVESRDSSMATGLMVMVVALFVVAVIAFAVLWTRPWQSSSNTNNRPAISDNSGQPGGGQSGGSSSQPPQSAQ